MTESRNVIQEIQVKFPAAKIVEEKTRDGIPTLWTIRPSFRDVLRFLKLEISEPFQMLYDLTAIDNRTRKDAANSEFTLVVHLLSLHRIAEIRIKVALPEESLSIPTITDIWPAANWYEREVWDMFGITFEGHPHLKRILMPPTWKGHPLRKDHYARATEVGLFQLPDAKEEAEQEALQFHPEDWGLKRSRDGTDFMFLNVGPHHPGTHGVLRIILQLDGEVILDAVPDIGYHHRGAEKMGERQTWHTYIPYTDRVDYLGGVMNNFPYVLAVEKLAGLEVPERAQVIRVMLAELFRIASHLVWYGTFAQDVGALSPVFYMFTDRERILEIIEAICGARMHPNWFRIGGVAQDLPRGWEKKILEFIRYLPKRLAQYDRMVMKNRIFKGRTQGIGKFSLAQAIEWGVTGPALRACGLKFDLRKARPYSGYENYEFEIPTALNGDCYDRAIVRIEEMRQSLRIIQQCVESMPAGPYKSRQTGTTPPLKDRTMLDIETLITHFLGVSWGPIIPQGEALVSVEATKGINGYYLTSDGDQHPYRVRIRSPSFPHLQMLPMIARGHQIPDLMAILGAMDYVLADVDR